ncbi:MAG: BMP family protein [Bacillota bacterium]
MKKTLAFVLMLAMVFALAAGCAQQDANTSQSPAAEESASLIATDAPAATTGVDVSKLKVALLLPTPVNDGGWSETAYNGLKLIEETYGVETQFVESLAQSDFEEMFRSFASSGYNVIFGHGYQFGDAAMKVALDYPEVKFIITSTDISQAPNVASMNTTPIQCGVIQGTAAAYATKTKVIGAIGGAVMPPITDDLNGFAAGVLNVDPSIKVLLKLTGDFEDAGLAKETAQAMIEEGADVIMYNLTSAATGVLEAVKANNIIAIPAISNQNDLAPDNILLSGVTDVTKGIFYVFSQIAEGKFEPKFYELGVDTGCVYYVPNEKIYDKVLTQEGQDAVESIFKKIESHEIDAYDLVDKVVPSTLKVG